MYDIHPLQKSSGIFYENLGNAKFYTNNWKIITYLNITSLETKLIMFRTILVQTDLLCSNIKISSYPACSTSLTLLKKLLPTIEEQDTSFKDLVGHSRPRRGLFNVIGKVFKVVIGTMDADDAEYYNNAINDLNIGEIDLTNLLKTQSQIVQSTITNFNNTVTNLHHAEDVFNTNIRLLQNVTRTINNTLEFQTLKQNTEDHITLLLIMFTELSREYSNLVNSILFAKQHTLHPSILTPNQIVRELSKTRKHLPTGTSYPVQLNKSNAYELLRLISLSVYYMDNKLIFVIYVPIAENTMFTMYHLLPVPMSSSNNNTYIFLRPSSDYMAITVNKMIYSLLFNLNDCKIISNQTYVCLKTRPLYNTLGHGNCESELLQAHVGIPKSCDIRISSIENEIWYQLNEKNKWLYIVPNFTHITIDCAENGIHDLVLSGTGFFKLTTHCKAYTKSITLIPVIDFSSSTDSYLPDFDITLNEEKSMSIPSFNFIPLHSPISNLDELKTASYKLEQISQLADQLSKKTLAYDKLESHDTLLFVIIVISMLMMIYYTFKLCNYCKRKRSNFCTRLMLTQSDNQVNVELRNTTYASLPNIPTVPNTVTSSTPLHTPPSTRRSARLRERL